MLNQSLGQYHSTHSRFKAATGEDIPTLLVLKGLGNCPVCGRTAIISDEAENQSIGGCSALQCSIRWMRIKGQYHFWVPPYSQLYQETVQLNKRPKGSKKTGILSYKGGNKAMANEYSVVITLQQEDKEDQVIEISSEERADALRKARRVIRGYGLSIKDSTREEDEEKTKTEVVFDLTELGLELPDDEDEEEED
jgi:hypothetical protein